MDRIKSYSYRINNYLLILLSFFISISIYITDVIIILLCLSWLLSGEFKKKISYIITNPIIYSCLLFFIYFFIRNLLGGNLIWHNTIQKQSLILLLPILYTLNINKKYIEISKYFFILGLFVNIFLSVFTFIYPENSFFKKGHYDNNIFAHGFIDHFDYSIFLCFGILLILYMGGKWNTKKSWKYWTTLIILLIFLLNSYGRIGIISFFIFSPIVFFLTKNSMKNYKFGLITLIFISFCYFYFSPFQHRINQTISNIYLFYNPMSLNEKIEKDALYIANQNDSLTKEDVIKQIMADTIWLNHIKNKKPRFETSLGKRLMYYKNSFSLLKINPILGIGINSFEKEYENQYNIPKTKHPHNNFMFIAIEAGLVGLFLMLLIFYQHIYNSINSRQFNVLKFIFPVFFLFIMLFDNYFLNHNTLTLFCLFSFLLFSQKEKESIIQNTHA